MSFASGGRIVVTLEAEDAVWGKQGDRGTILQTARCLPQEEAPHPWSEPWSAPEAEPGEPYVALRVRMDSGRLVVWRNWEVRPLDAVERLAELA